MPQTKRLESPILGACFTRECKEQTGEYKERVGVPVPCPMFLVSQEALPCSKNSTGCRDKIHRQGSLHSRRLYRALPEASGPRSRCQQGWPQVRPLPDLQTAAPSLCPQRPPSNAHSLFSEGHQSSQIRAPPLRPHLTIITSLGAPSPNTATLGVRASACEFWAGGR